MKLKNMYKNFLLFITMCVMLENGMAQEVFFFNDGTDNSFYDQGIVNVNDLGGSTFEHTFPPGGPQWNDKVPCSTTAFKGVTSLKFNYTSSSTGNWKARIHRSGWATANIKGLDSLSFYIYSEAGLPKSALPHISLLCDGITTKTYSLGAYNNDVSAAKWQQIRFPLSVIINDTDNASLNLANTEALVFNQSETNNTSRTILLDEISFYKALGEVPAVLNLSAEGYDSHAELTWEQPVNQLDYRIYASFDGGTNYELRTETSNNSFMDFLPSNGRNKMVFYKVVSVAQGKESSPIEKSVEIKDFTDDELMDMVQRYSFRYFWEGAHQASGMALERSNGNGRTAASGATGMGLMAMIVAHERNYEPQEDIKLRVLKILDFLSTCDRHHGAWSHWYNADTKKSQAFTTKDNGGDLVETSYVAQALIALKHYFSDNSEKSVQIRSKADKLWKEIDWSWYRNGGQNTLYWHWSPDYNFGMNMQVRGWNESLVTYIMAAASPDFSIPKIVYTNGWTKNGSIFNRRRFYDFSINLSPNWGGPLFWLHYSHLGISPRGLKDQYVDYWTEHVNTTKIHVEYAKENPLNRKNYSDKCWGLTASDDPDGYTAHQPWSNDNGTISPTAALASMPYTPEESMKALKYFYRERGAELFGIYGPYDAFNDDRSWVQEAYIGIDQGPIVVMIENHRSGLLWNNVMKDADVQAGLDKLGFEYQVNTAQKKINVLPDVHFYPNPSKGKVWFNAKEFNQRALSQVNVYSMDGQMVKICQIDQSGSAEYIDLSDLDNGMYLVQIENEKRVFRNKVVIRK